VRSPTAALRDLIFVLAVAACASAAAAAVAAALAAADAAGPGTPQLQSHRPAAAAVPIGAVRTGIYLYAVQELDFARKTFHPSFEVWFRWRGDGFDPLANVDVSGARSITIVSEDRRKLPNGENYAVARIDAVVNADYDTSAFPFDRHRLRVDIESPYEDDYLVYEADAENSMLDPEPYSPGWKLSRFAIGEERKQYPSNFGLVERKGERYSSLKFEVVAERIGWRIAVDYFIGFIVCVLLCLLGYLIPPSLLSVRASLVTTATFTAVGNKYIVNSLTETSVTATLANAAVVTSFAMVLLLMLTSIVCERLIDTGKRTKAIRLNRNVGIASAVGYVLVMAYFFWRALVAGRI
jgi:hypothetical protein